MSEHQADSAVDVVGDYHDVVGGRLCKSVEADYAALLESEDGHDVEVSVSPHGRECWIAGLYAATRAWGYCG